MNKELILKNTKFYGSDCEELKYLLGGIGTGTVSLGARGNLCDFEIMNEPKKGFTPPYTFFAIRCETGDKTAAKILEARLNKHNDSCLGFPATALAGLPRFSKSVFSSRYPFAYVDFFDETLPLEVKLTAYTPFVPLDADDSGMPLFSLRYTVKNTGNSAARVSIAGTLTGLCGYEGEWDVFNNIIPKCKQTGKELNADGYKGILLSGELGKDERYYNEMALMTECKDATVKPEWLAGAWQDAAFEFWHDFKSDGELAPAQKEERVKSVFDGGTFAKSGSVCVKHVLEPGETKDFEFLVAWYSPNRYLTWFQDLAAKNKDRGCYKNYYAYRFDGAAEVGDYYFANKEALCSRSLKFSEALYSSTMPKDVIDAVAANLHIIRSTTCFRAFKEGKFYAFEGSSEKFGFCDGNCSHVWNYAQTLAFFFPELERSMRRTEFLTEIEESGHIPFRVRKDFRDARWDLPPAADGQLGSILRCYREWKISGDDAFIRELFPNIKRAMDYCIAVWDKEGTGALSGMQHNTYDIEFYGRTSMLQSIYCAALCAFVKIAEFCGEPAGKYKQYFEKSQSELMKLYDGEYFYQEVEDIDAYKYQYGRGCLADQLFGLMLARSYGLELNGVDKKAEKSALKSIYKYNFMHDFYGHENLQRVYALNGDKGLLLCSFPKGGRPFYPFVYADEVWAGIEYQVAAHMAHAGLYKECIDIVKAVRARYDGKKRNPFAEAECGYHYARSLASFAVYRALAGLEMPSKVFKPYKSGAFSAFYIEADEWGIVERSPVGEDIRTPLFILTDKADRRIINNGEPLNRLSQI